MISKDNLLTSKNHQFCSPKRGSPIILGANLQKVPYCLPTSLCILSMKGNLASLEALRSLTDLGASEKLLLTKINTLEIRGNADRKRG